MRAFIFVFALIFLFLTIPFVLSTDFPSPFQEAENNDEAIIHGSGGDIENSEIGITQAGYQSQNDFVQFYDSNEEGDKELWSEKQICDFTKGCLSDKFCYPYGYVQDSLYCGVDKDYYEKWGIRRNSFVNQSEEEEFCHQDFECESNFCFNEECVGSLQNLIKETAIMVYQSLNMGDEGVKEDTMKETEKNETVLIEEKGILNFLRKIF